jgi:alkyldihydroxyacetonephosphate synthase
MLRLSNAIETETTLVLSGKDRLVGWARLALQRLGYGDERSLLIYGITGERSATATVKRRVEQAVRAHGGLPVGKLIGRTWKKSRFLTPYLRNTLWEKGYALDTLETAVPWSGVFPTAYAIQKALSEALSVIGEKVLVFAHLSHIYPDGASIYTTFLYRREADPGVSLARWQMLKSAASQAVMAHGGTISHQHGVGLDHAPYLASEKGTLGIEMLESVRARLDPDGLLNPGKLLHAHQSELQFPYKGRYG